ncbi:MAG: metallophosphoesterase [Opitutaceae bacterium]|nr:metallophosphoesterase [Opitutaceae bacterium]
MKRRHFISQVAGGAVGAALISGSARAQSAAAAGRLTRTPMVLMAPRPDGFEAVWGVTTLCRGRIEWLDADGGKGVAGTDAFGFVPQGDKVLRVRVAGLKPGRTYRVRAVTSAAESDLVETTDWKPFRTLDPAAGATSFVVWNDTHINNPTIKALHEKTPSADFLLWNGDTCNDWKTEDLLVPTLLHPGECDITDGRPLLLTWGNHDVRGRFGFRMPEMVATPSGRPFYAFRSGPVAFIFMDTGEDKPDDHPTFAGRVSFDRLRKEQARWLAKTIKLPEFATAPYRVMCCHIPLRWTDESPQDYANRGFDRHSGRSRAAWHDSLVAWKAQVIISGHTHRATWMPATAEFPYAQLIGGGPQPERATWMEGAADADRLRIVVRNLTGGTAHDVSFSPLV